MERLRGSKTNFNRRVQTSAALVERIVVTASKNIAELEKLKSRVQRTKSPKTIKSQSETLKAILAEGNYLIKISDNKGYVNQQIDYYLEQEKGIISAAAREGIVSLSSTFEEFVRQILLKYYEDDIRRLKESDVKVSYTEIVDAVMNEELILRNIASKAVSNTMRGSLYEWGQQLKKIGITNFFASDDLKEMFLVRNCIVHNNSHANVELEKTNTTRYKAHKPLKVTYDDYQRYKTDINKTTTWLKYEYNKLFPNRYTTWDKENYGLSHPVEMPQNPEE